MWQYAFRYVKTHRQEELNKTWGDITATVDEGFSEHKFMREFVWVCLVSGFSAKVVAGKIDAVLRVHNIEDADGSYIPITSANIIEDMRPVYAVYKNVNKARAIQAVRKIILKLGWWPGFCTQYLGPAGADPKKLRGLPFMGPALSCHLARNLGNLDAIKPDVHLKRLAQAYKLDSPEALCDALAGRELSRGYVDLVLWIAAADCGTL